MKETKRIASTHERLREAMGDAKIKQIELSTESGLSHSTISRYLSGKVEPRQEAIIKLSKVLGVSEWWLWGYDVPKNRTPEHKKNDALVDVIKQLRVDPDFFDVVTQLAELPAEEYGSIKLLISSLRKK